MSLTNLVWFLGGAMVGAIVGVVITACCVVSGNNRKDDE